MQNKCFSRVYWNQPVYLSICVSMYQSVYKILVTSFCQTAGGGIKSHLVTGLVTTGLSEVTHLVLVSDVDATREPQAERFKYLWYSDPNPVVNSRCFLSFNPFLNSKF